MLWSYHSLATSTFVCPDGEKQCNLINAPAIINSTNNIIFCDQEKECASSVINCPSDGRCIVYCQNYGSCSGAIINCPRNGDCDIYCDNDFACYFAMIIGPNNQLFTIHCGEQYGCRSSIIHAENVSKFILTSRSSSATRNVTIYFPPKQGNTKRAIIISVDQAFTRNYYEKSNLYAINGFLDVDIHSNATFSNYGGIMWCGENYEASCWIAYDSWRCDNVSGNESSCDNPVTTSPTSEPSMEPTSIPTTDPSAEPSFDPTLYPTNGPSTNPTPIPTNSPSETPSQLPVCTQITDCYLE